VKLIRIIRPDLVHVRAKRKGDNPATRPLLLRVPDPRRWGLRR